MPVTQLPGGNGLVTDYLDILVPGPAASAATPRHCFFIESHESDPRTLLRPQATRLSGVLDTLEVHNREAIERQLAHTDFLALLVHDELARRD